MVLPVIEETPKSIMIVDDHPMVRRGLTSLIELEHEFYVCGEAACTREALDILSRKVPDLAIIDLELDGDDGLELIKLLRSRYPNIPLMVLSMHDESLYAERCLRAGAKAYLSKQQLDETVLVAIRQLLQGKIYLSKAQESRLSEKFISGNSSISDSPLDALSNRELQVFRLIGQGKTTRQIAQLLFLSHKTIESHREHIKRKLNIDSAAKLMRFAIHWSER